MTEHGADTIGGDIIASMDVCALQECTLVVKINADCVIGREQRGMVVTIYLDPENTQGSTPDILMELEWTGAHIIR
jgi:hypothetical protein